MYIEKYFPHNFNDFIVHKDKINIYKKYDLSNNILIYGPSGSGKRTIIYNILNNIYGLKVYNLKEIFMDDMGGKHYFPMYGSDYHFEIDISNYLNKDRLLIEDFIKETSNTMNIKTNQRKIFILLNSDKLSIVVQNSLRVIIEKSKSKFIFITNKLSKISSILRSRFIEIRIPSPTDNEIDALIDNIILKEGYKITKRNKTSILDKCINKNCMKEVLYNLEINFLSGKYKSFTMSYIEKINNIIELSKVLTIENFIKVRELIFDLYVTDTDPNIIIKKLLDYYFKRIKNSHKNKCNCHVYICNNAIKCDYGILKGNKFPIHIEKFIWTCEKIINYCDDNYLDLNISDKNIFIDIDTLDINIKSNEDILNIIKNNNKKTFDNFHITNINIIDKILTSEFKENNNKLINNILIDKQRENFNDNKKIIELDINNIIINNIDITERYNNIELKIINKETLSNINRNIKFIIVKEQVSKVRKIKKK
jgi:replication factor C subunit 3/5